MPSKIVTGAAATGNGRVVGAEEEWKNLNWKEMLDLSLTTAHREQLRASGISDEVIAEEGYRSITKKDLYVLAGWGFKKSQITTGWVKHLTLYDRVPDGHKRPFFDTITLRRDQPRFDGPEKRKEIRYENLFGSHLQLSIPRRCYPALFDVSAELWVTEGTKKADAGATVGLTTVCLMGVWGATEKDPITKEHKLRRDWDVVPLDGRIVYVAFDSDVMTKSSVAAALATLKRLLECRGARVLLVYLPSGPDGKKVGLDDYLVAGHTVEQLKALASNDLRAQPKKSRTIPSDFINREGKLWALVKTEAGVTPEPLTNVEIEIVESHLLDDGSRGELESLIVVELRDDRSPPQRVTLTAEQYSQPYIWLRKVNPTFAILPRCESIVMNAAIPAVSAATMKTLRIYTHTGPRVIGNARIFLHPGLPPEVAIVQLEGEGLKAMRLPYPPTTGAALIKAIRASAAMLDAAPDRITVPLHGAVYRAPLAAIEHDTSLVLKGVTTSGKSELGLLAQQHFGARYTRRSLPGNFDSTGNASGKLAFSMYGMIGVFDDLNPEGTEAEYRQRQSNAAKVIRRSRRDRLRADLRARESYPPRCFSILTVEDHAFQHSTVLRSLILQIAEGDVLPAKLLPAQQAGRAGLYAAAMAGYVDWLMRKYDSIEAYVRAYLDWRMERTAIETTRLSRLPDATRQLWIGHLLFASFALDAGAFTLDEANAYLARCETALEGMVKAQEDPSKDADPIANSFARLRAALGSTTYFCGVDSDRPEGFERLCGLRYEERWMETPEGERRSYNWSHPRVCCGAVEIQDGTMTMVYLDLARAWKVINEQRIEGFPFRLSAREWARQLEERGLLAKTDQADRGKRGARKSLFDPETGDKRQRGVLWLRPETVFGFVPKIEQASTDDGYEPVSNKEIDRRAERVISCG